MQQTVLITGASSGIGRALALHYASPERRLLLFGRNLERLEAVAALCTEKGSNCGVYVLDLCNRNATLELMHELLSKETVDLAFLNAAVLGNSSPHPYETFDEIDTVLQTNLYGVFHMLLPLVAHMRNKKSGQLALVSSLAGWIPLPRYAAYCASKAALTAYGQALRAQLSDEGIRVSVVAPGYVDTPMGRQTSTKRRRLEVSAEAAAQAIKKGLRSNRGLISFPWILSVGAKSLALLFDPMRDYVLKMLKAPSRL